MDKKCFLPLNIDKLLSLRELWLNGNILNPPGNITKSASIKELVVSYYSDVEPCQVPDWIFEMRGLEKIRFSVCRFTRISDKINQLKNLVDLDFGCSLSDMQSFPDLSGLVSLKRLIVSGESVQGQRLPAYSLLPQILEGIKNLKQLENLDLSDWRPKKKTEWLVIDNKRHSIPDIFDRYPKLTELSLSGMRLDFVPDSVFQLKSLRKLSLNNNKFGNEEIR